MKFEYFAGEQRSPEWFALRLGRVTSSRLTDWLAVSKAEKTAGQPLKARLDYEKELLFEKKFNTSFETFVTDAMQEGVDYEEFARQEYSRIKGVPVVELGAWYSDTFVASPDGGVGEDGMLEIKIVKDNSFADVLMVTYDKKDKKKEHPIPALSEKGSQSKWWMQIQGQLWAGGRKWCDFVAVNFNTKKIKIIRVEPDAEFHKWIELTITEDFNLDETVFDDDQLYDIKERDEPQVHGAPPIKNKAQKELEGF